MENFDGKDTAALLSKKGSIFLQIKSLFSAGPHSTGKVRNLDLFFRTFLSRFLILFIFRSVWVPAKCQTALAFFEIKISNRFASNRKTSKFEQIKVKFEAVKQARFFSQRITND